MINTSENDKKADLEVFDTEEDAKKAAADVLGTGAARGHRHATDGAPRASQHVEDPSWQHHWER